MRLETAVFWKILFFSLLAGYCWYYAPYGINETDGGFLTGLAWQSLNGKALFSEIVYVRPPLPVWLRALELNVLPATWAVLGERWIFYAKVAAYAWLGAAVLADGARRWMLALFGFAMSAHSYPAAAWHTVDGILFGALSIWCWTHWRSRAGAVLSGIFMAACLLCKQSFYLIPGILLIISLLNFKLIILNFKFNHILWAVSGFVGAIALFLLYLYQTQSLSGFLLLTSGAASGGQALQHGLLDYFRINPVVAAGSALLLASVGWWYRKGRGARMAFTGWVLWLVWLMGTYAWAIYSRQDSTAPFAQVRLLFLVATAWGIYRLWRRHWNAAQAAGFYALLGLSWCTAVSWGYSLPILFALPWVYAALDISDDLFKAAFSRTPALRWPVLALSGLLVLFRYGYEFVYRDGPRSKMTEPLGDIFPALQGIYSSPETAALYSDLRDLAARYGPDFKTLPAFPQANFLTGTPPPLPLDWVVEREMQAGKKRVIDVLEANQPYLFIEKQYREQLNRDPELQLTAACLKQGSVVEETAHFWVIRLPDTEALKH